MSKKFKGDEYKREVKKPSAYAHKHESHQSSEYRRGKHIGRKGGGKSRGV